MKQAVTKFVSNGLKMSKHDEQELTKWKNKLKLWMILHKESFDFKNDFYPHCDRCCHSTVIDGVLFRRCPDKKIIYTKKDELIVYDNPFYSDFYSDGICVEWIKDV